MKHDPSWNGRRVVRGGVTYYVTARPSVRGPHQVDLEAWTRVRSGGPEFAQVESFRAHGDRWGLCGTELPADYPERMPGAGPFLEVARNAREVIRAAYPEAAPQVDSWPASSDANVLSLLEHELVLRYRPIAGSNAEPELFVDDLGRACWADRRRVLSIEVVDSPENRTAFLRRFELGPEVSFDLALVGAIVAREGATVLGPRDQEFRLWPAGGLAQAVRS